jgi:hypothetical protein
MYVCICTLRHSYTLAFYTGALYNNHIKENYARFDILAAVTVNPAYSECDTVQLCGEIQVPKSVNGINVPSQNW